MTSKCNSKFRPSLSASLPHRFLSSPSGSAMVGRFLAVFVSRLSTPAPLLGFWTLSVWISVCLRLSVRCQNARCGLPLTLFFFFLAEVLKLSTAIFLFTLLTPHITRGQASSTPCTSLRHNYNYQLVWRLLTFIYTHYLSG